MVRISAILLAAGLSSRMEGRNKLLLPYQGRPLIRHVMSGLEACEIDQLIIVTNERLMDYLASDPPAGPWKIAVNPDYHKGMMTSLHHGLRLIADDTRGILICLADMPLISPEEYLQIINSFRQQYPIDPQVITVPYYQEKQGNPVLFSRTYKAELLQRDGPEGPKSLLDRFSAHVRRVEIGSPHIIYDIDTPDHYNQLLNDT